MINTLMMAILFIGSQTYFLQDAAHKGRFCVPYENIYKRGCFFLNGVNRQRLNSLVFSLHPLKLRTLCAQHIWSENGFKK